jgi:RNA polymerase sigma-70 factor (ECF subfamily)
VVDRDLELLRAWTSGDSAAGNELVRRHFRSIYRFFRSKVGTHADELTQRTFLGCVEGRDRWQGIGSFRGYLYGIARKQLLRHLEGRGLGRESLDLSRLSMRDLGTSPSSAIGRREEHELLLDALQRIPVDFQIVVELFYWESFAIGEIAEVLGVAVGTVKSRLHRAKALLRAELEAMAADTVGSELERQARALALQLDPGERE